ASLANFNVDAIAWFVKNICHVAGLCTILNTIVVCKYTSAHCYTTSMKQKTESHGQLDNLSLSSIICCLYFKSSFKF
ncbi:hypothetical protein, partial [Okeania sp. SIO1I7]|uniref:hypothetical protein n=1 Tax=Okeania sp. SIO1I7 TaxID=2607772 RepID=UPI0025EE6906